MPICSRISVCYCCIEKGAWRRKRPDGKLPAPEIIVSFGVTAPSWEPLPRLASEGAGIDSVAESRGMNSMIRNTSLGPPSKGAGAVPIYDLVPAEVSL